MRLVLRSTLRRLSRHVDARLRTDRLVDRVPVGRRHGRQQRIAGRVAAVVAVDAHGLLSADPMRHCRRRCGDLAHHFFTVRLCASRGAGFAVARRRHRNRGAHRTVGSVRHCRRIRRSGRHAVCLRQGQHIAGNARHSALDRCAGDGAARRPADDRRTRGRRSCGGAAAGYDRASHRILAHHPRRCHPGHCGAASARHVGSLRALFAQRVARS